MQVSDPYRWLEDPDSEETKEYVASQNSLTLPFINSCPKRQAIYERLKQLWDFPKYSCPVKTGDGKYYFFKNTGLQNQRYLFDFKSISIVFFKFKFLKQRALRPRHPGLRAPSISGPKHILGGRHRGADQRGVQSGRKCLRLRLVVQWLRLEHHSLHRDQDWLLFIYY